MKLCLGTHNEGFHRNTSSKGKTRQHQECPSTEWGRSPGDKGQWKQRDTECLLHVFFFPFSFVGQNYPQEYRDTQTHGKVWRNVELPSTEQDQLRKHLNELDMPKSMRPDRMHPWVLRELALRGYSSLKHHGDGGSFLSSEKKQMSLPSSRRARGRIRQLQPSQTWCIPLKGDRLNPLGSHSQP